MRVTTAFKRLLRLPGASVADVSFAAEGVIVTVRLRRRRRVCAAPGRAHGTGSKRMPQSRQRSRRNSHSMMHRLAPRSRWRQRLTRRSWISSWRPVCPQPAQTRRRRRNRTVTITPSAPNETSATLAPGKRSRRLNAVVTRTSPSRVSR